MVVDMGSVPIAGTHLTHDLLLNGVCVSPTTIDLSVLVKSNPGQRHWVHSCPQ